jgi:hypothetical protein
MVRFSIIALLALAPVASGVGDPITRADREATAQRIRLRLAAADLAVDVLVVHARQSDLSAEFDALAETLTPVDRAASKRSLAEAARLTRRAAGLCAFAERQIGQGFANQTEAGKDRRVGGTAAASMLELARVRYATGLDLVEIGESLTRRAAAELANVADLMAGK